MKVGDKVVYRKCGGFKYRRGTVIGIDWEKSKVAIRRLLSVKILSLRIDEVIVYKRIKEWQRRKTIRTKR